MNATTQKFIQGFGSILDLCPSPPPPINVFSVPKRTVEGQLEKTWGMVGAAFKQSIADFDSEIHVPEKQNESKK